MLENVLDKSVSFLLRADLLMGNIRGFYRAGWSFCAAGRSPWARIIALGAVIAMLGGCSHLHPGSAEEYVYVTVQRTFLRDRVAAVSNRTGNVQNGERLVVLEHGRRFLRVRSPEGAVGWIDEKAVATQPIYDAFQTLRQTHQHDPAVSSASLRDEANLHLKPGRDTEHFYRLAEGDKLELLERATLPKPVTAVLAPAKASKPPVGLGATGPAATGPAATRPAATGAGVAAAARKGGKPAAEAASPAIQMEDWWLARDAQGRTGWLLSRYLDVDVPEALAQYSEGQRYVGAYVLSTVYDAGLGQDGGSSKGGNVPIYLTVMAAPGAGMAYDFDQVRVFTWNLRLHRYETGFRDKNIEGFLPVAIKTATDPNGKSPLAQTPEPTFTYKVLAGDAGPVVPNPTTGVVTPGRTIEKTYRLEGNLVRRLAPPGSKDESEAHPVAEAKKAGGAKAARKANGAKPARPKRH
jgi:hypothetical protein